MYLFFLNDTAPTEIYPLSLHDSLPISRMSDACTSTRPTPGTRDNTGRIRSEEHTSELQSLAYLVCRLLLEKKFFFGTSSSWPGTGTTPRQTVRTLTRA